LTIGVNGSRESEGSSVVVLVGVDSALSCIGIFGRLGGVPAVPKDDRLIVMTKDDAEMTFD